LSFIGHFALVTDGIEEWMLMPRGQGVKDSRFRGIIGKLQHQGLAAKNDSVIFFLTPDA